MTLWIRTFSFPKVTQEAPSAAVLLTTVGSGYAYCKCSLSHCGSGTRLRPSHSESSESASRALVVPRAGQGAAVEELAAQYGVPITYLGLTGGSRISFTGLFDVPLSDAIVEYEGAIPKLMSPRRTQN